MNPNKITNASTNTNTNEKIHEINVVSWPQQIKDTFNKLILPRLNHQKIQIKNQTKTQTQVQIQIQKKYCGIKLVATN